MKPDRFNAMNDLIIEVREAFPFAMPEAEMCSGICIGCSKKLLEIVDSELCYWESQLEAGEAPTFGELRRLGKLCKNVHRTLKRNKLVS